MKVHSYTEPELYRRADRPDSWWIKWTDESGKRRAKRGYPDKRATQVLARKIAEQLKRRASGDLTAEHRDTEIEQHVSAFADHLRAGGAGEKHRKQVLSFLRRGLKSMQVGTLAHFDLPRADKFLADLADGVMGRALSQKSVDEYAHVLKQFGEWAVDAERLARNPLRKLRRVVKPKTREAFATFTRKALTVAEVDRLVESALVRPVQEYARTHPGCDPADLERCARAGRERAMAYLLGAFVGVRKGALRTLTWSDLLLDGDAPTVTLRARYAKNRRTSMVPVPTWLGAELRAWRETVATWIGRPVREAERVLPNLPRNIARRMQADAKFAQIEVADGERLDFHCLRVTTATLCADANVNPVDAQKLLTHSDVSTTIAVYTRLKPEHARRAADALPIPRTAGTVGAIEAARDCEEDTTRSAGGGA